MHSQCLFALAGYTTCRRHANNRVLHGASVLAYCSIHREATPAVVRPVI